MSDYLKNLAKRSVGDFAVVRPRPQARFESPQNQATTQETRLDTGVESMRTQQEFAAPEQKQTPPGNKQTPPPVTAMVKPNSQSINTDLLQPPINSINPQREKPEQILNSLTRHSNISQSKTEGQTDAARTTFDPSAKSAMNDIKPTAPDFDNIRSVQQEESRLAQQEPISQTEVVETHIHRVDTASLAEKHFTQQRSVAEPKNAPVIRVNIGRVEIRAVSPPKPQARPRVEKSQPQLSITDYLNKRRGQR